MAQSLQDTTVSEILSILATNRVFSMTDPNVEKKLVCIMETIKKQCAKDKDLVLPWLTNPKDVSCYLLLKKLGLGTVPNIIDIPFSANSSQCVNAILPSNHFVKLVPDYSTGDDVIRDAITCRIINHVFPDSPHFLTYYDAGFMPLLSNKFVIPYNSIVDLNSCMESYYYDKVTIDISTFDVKSFEQCSMSPRYTPPTKKPGYYANETDNKINTIRGVVYCNALAFKPIHLMPLSKCITNEKDAFFAHLFTDPNDGLYNMMQQMYHLGKEYGFVHNDAHSENVVYDLENKTFVLLDYGRVVMTSGSYTKPGIIHEKTYQEIATSEAVKFCKDISYYKGNDFIDVYDDSKWLFIQPGFENGIDHTNAGKYLQVMNDIATISWNIWKELQNYSTNAGIFNGVILENIKLFFSIDVNSKVIINFENYSYILNVIYSHSPKNIRAIATGLLWLALYLRAVFFDVNQPGKLLYELDYANVCGTTPNAPLWAHGQVLPMMYYNVLGSLPKFAGCYFEYNGKKYMTTIIEYMFGPLKYTQAGGSRKKQSMKGGEKIQDLPKKITELDINDKNLIPVLSDENTQEQPEETMESPPTLTAAVVYIVDANGFTNTNYEPQEDKKIYEPLAKDIKPFVPSYIPTTPQEMMNQFTGNMSVPRDVHDHHFNLLGLPM